MQFTRMSPFSGQMHTKDIPVTLEQLNAWNNGKCIQDAMPNISAADHEFIMTGITSEEWDDLPSEEDEDLGGDFNPSEDTSPQCGY